MKNTMRYKGYTGSVEYSEEDEVLYGKILFIHALVTYEGRDVKELKQSFEEAVDDYLEICEAQGLQPEKTYSGNLRLRMGSDLHAKISLAAVHKNTSVNSYIVNAVNAQLARDGELYSSHD